MLLAIGVAVVVVGAVLSGAAVLDSALLLPLGDEREVVTAVVVMVGAVLSWAVLLLGLLVSWAGLVLLVWLQEASLGSHGA